MATRKPPRLNARPPLGDALQLGARAILEGAIETLDEDGIDPEAVDYRIQCASVLLHLQAENEVPRG